MVDRSLVPQRQTARLRRSLTADRQLPRASSKYELVARLVELRDGDPFIGLFVDVTRREIVASLQELAAAGVDLTGLDVVWPPATRRPTRVTWSGASAGSTATASRCPFDADDVLAAYARPAT